MPVLEEFEPQLLLVSAGFDAAEGDPQGKMRVSPAGFAEMTRRLLPSFDGKLVLVLEGGYVPDVTAACAAAVVRELLVASKALSQTESEPKRRQGGGWGTLTPDLLREVVAIQRPFWASLRTEEHRELVESYFDDRSKRCGRGKRTQFADSAYPSGSPPARQRA